VYVRPGEEDLNVNAYDIHQVMAKVQARRGGFKCECLRHTPSDGKSSGQERRIDCPHPYYKKFNNISSGVFL
jgi:hypothetical protein